jgi:hypothetical protein
VGSLAKDANYRSVRNISCPTCYRGHVDCVIKIPFKSPSNPELVFAECDPNDCKFDSERREKLISDCMRFIDEYEAEKARRKGT